MKNRSPSCRRCFRRRGEVMEPDYCPVMVVHVVLLVAVAMRASGQAVAEARHGHVAGMMHPCDDVLSRVVL